MERGNLEQRISRLERTNRILTGMLGAFALLALAGWTVSTQAVSNVIKTRELQVLSKDGKVIVSAKYDGWAQGGGIYIHEKSGKARSWWRASPKGAHLIMVGGDKDPMATATLSASAVTDQAGLSLFSKKEAQMSLRVIGDNPGILGWSPPDKEVIRIPPKAPSK